MRIDSRALSLALCLAVPLAATVEPAAAQGRSFGQAQPGSKGRKVRRDREPPRPGALHGTAAVDALRGSLGQRVRELGGNLETVAAALTGDGSLWISAEGQLMFVDAIGEDAADDGSASPAAPLAPAAPPPPPTAVLPNGMPIHHSKSGAAFTMYLDFDGEVVRSQFWGINARSTQGLTIDADAFTFNAEEQAVISRTWGRVAEDWAPFDIDVTTERPAVIGSTVLWSIIGRAPADLGFSSGIGGISLFSLGYMPFGLQTPIFTFWAPHGATNHADIADTISHEAGHMQGLLHDGVILPDGSIAEYYTGHGTGPTSWGPVMGSPAGRQVTQWSQGGYPGSVNPLCVSPGQCPTYGAQDDIAIIGARLGFRADDLTDAVASALPLTFPAVGYITSTADTDVFVLPPAGQIRLEITPFRAGELTDGGNLDVAADIVNAAGLVVAHADDLDQTTATLTATLGAGVHYLRIRPSFSPDNYPAYGSLGEYTVTGTFTSSVLIAAFQSPLPAQTLNAGRTIPVKFGLTAPVAVARVQLWSSPGGLPGDVLAEAECKAQGQRQHCNLKLPKSLLPGASYWIAVQYQATEGHWITPATDRGANATNPFSFVAK